METGTSKNITGLIDSNGGAPIAGPVTNVPTSLPAGGDDADDWWSALGTRDDVNQSGYGFGRLVAYEATPAFLQYLLDVSKQDPEPDVWPASSNWLNTAGADFTTEELASVDPDLADYQGGAGGWVAYGGINLPGYLPVQTDVVAVQLGAESNLETVSYSVQANSGDFEAAPVFSPSLAPFPG
jgi:hypothetical protein